MDPLSYASLSRVEIPGTERGPDPVPSPTITIDRYTLHAELAVGGMATVFLGRSQGSVGFSRTVAVKRLHKQFAHDPGFVAMFHDEARLAARIRHPNVVPTLDVVATDGELFLVMEYVHGETLGRLMRLTKKREERIPLRIAAALVVAVLHGLDAAHEAKDEYGRPLDIVHRDISPHNVLVGVDGVARVLDFGVAKATGRIQSTRDGEIKGKLAYMAPEQVKGDPNISRRADLYSSAVVLWEAIAGRRLFQAENDVALLSRVLTGDIPYLSRLVPEVPRAIDDVIRCAMAPDPQDRFASAKEMCLAIENVVPLATTSEVAAWLQRIAGSKLKERAERIAAIERDAAVPISSRAVMAEVHASYTNSSDVRSLRGSRHGEEAAPQNRLRIGLLAAGFGVVAGLGVIAGILLSGAKSPTKHEERLELILTATVTPPQNSSEVRAAASSIPPAETATSATTAVLNLDPVVTPPARVVPVKASKPKGKCASPYAIDENGNKVFKPECM